jgi:hypothetical protein
MSHPVRERPRKRWQYSLRWLAAAVTLFCVLLATFGPNGWLLVIVGTLALLLGLLAIFAQIGVASSIPSRRGITGIAAACTAAAAGIVYLAGTQAGRASPLAQLLLPFEHVPFGGVPLWLTAWCLGSVLRRTGTDFDLLQVRRAAGISLLGFLCLYTYAVFITIDSQKNDWQGAASLSQRYATHYLIFVASLATSIPWICLIRRRAMAGAPRWSAFDFISLALLTCSLLMILLWLLLRLSPQSFAEKGDLGEVLGLLILTFYALPMGSCLFLAGLVIEIWRDRWHRRLTLMSGAFFAAYWLLWAFEPGLAYLPLAL